MKIIIIGAGPGGYETAVEAASRGVEVILIEAGNVGGTCLNEGCIPTKTLCRSAVLYSDVKRSSEFGIFLGCEPSVDFAKVQERKRVVIDQLRTGVESLLKNKFITLVRGRAEIIGEHSVRVTRGVDYDGNIGDDNTAAGKEVFENNESQPVVEEYTADCIIIATGSHPAALPINGSDLRGVLNSTEMLNIDHIPERLCIIGAGVIGLEFACIFNSFGSKVTVIEYCPQILPNFDPDLAKRLKQSLSKSGIDIILKAAVQSISEVMEESNRDAAGVCGKPATALQVEYKLKDEVLSVTADNVLMAVGRRPSVDGLGLENVGIEYTPKGVAVDENMRTNVPSIYAIGDVNGRCMLAHAAIYQGIRALNAICGENDSMDLSVVPSVVFISPEAASVGLTEQECEKRNLGYTALKSFFRANGKAVSQGETDGFIKVLVAKGDVSGQILGCHLFGPHAADLIAEIGALIHCKATVDDLKSIIHAHPTLSEVFTKLA